MYELGLEKCSLGERISSVLTLIYFTLLTMRMAVMKNIMTKIVVLFAALCLAGCSNTSNQTVGTVTGAVAGGLLGSLFGGGAGKVIAIGAGAIIGALVGDSIGKSMDENDKMRMTQSLDTPTGQSTTWVNEKTGVRYKVVPMKTVVVKGYTHCRQYYTTAVVNGNMQKMYGTACQSADGNWYAIRQ